MHELFLPFVFVTFLHMIYVQSSCNVEFKVLLRFNCSTKLGFNAGIKGNTSLRFHVLQLLV